MSTTVTTLQARVGKILDGGYMLGAGTGGTTTTLVCATFPLRDAGRSSSTYAGAVVVRPNAALAADVYRRVQTDDPTTGTLTIYTAEAWTNAPAGGDAFELWTTFDPSQVADYANRAMQAMTGVEEVDLTGVDSQRQYALSAYTWLTDAGQVLGLLLRSGDSGAYTWDEVPGWSITRDETALTLNLTGRTVTSNDTLRLLALRDYAGLSTLAAQASTSDAPMPWLAYETALLMLQEPAARRYSPDLDPVFQRIERDVAAKVAYWRDLLSPRPHRRLFAQSTRYWGPR